MVHTNGLSRAHFVTGVKPQAFKQARLGYIKGDVNRGMDAKTCIAVSMAYFAVASTIFH